MGRSASELKPAGGKSLAHHLEQRMGARVAMTSGSPGRHDLADLGVLGEIDGEVAQVLVVARGDDVADVSFSRTSTMLQRSTLATSAMRRTTVKRMSRKSRLEESACVSSRTTCASRSRRSSASMYSRRRSWPRMRATSSAGAKRLADEVVGARRERARHLVVAVEAA